MKIAVLSDVHGNVPALQAVLDDIERWGPDRVVVDGDLINRGPLSLDCLALLKARFPDAAYIQGNHEEFVLRVANQPPPPDSAEFELTRFAAWTARQMGEGLTEVAGWADHLELRDPRGGRLHVTHGTRLGNRDAIRADTPESELSAKLGDARELFVTAHTHTPVVREFDGTLIVNIGSVGSPFDGDPRAAYAQLSFSRDRWQAHIRRIAFDREQAERNFVDSGFMDGGGPLTQVMLTELRRNRGLMGRWMRTYYEPVVRGEISVAEAVECYLAS